MAEFKPVFDTLIRNEGGYVNHCIADDRGGQTFAGISRRFHPSWPGWLLIDVNNIDNPKLTQLVYQFYLLEFWQGIKGDYIIHQRVAANIFDFAVNAGVRTAVKMSQMVVTATPDGIVGKQTLTRLNAVDAEIFVTKYTLAKVARYQMIVKNDRSQEKFLMGWLSRALGGIV